MGERKLEVHNAFLLPEHSTSVLPTDCTHSFSANKNMRTATAHQNRSPPSCWSHGPTRAGALHLHVVRQPAIRQVMSMRQLQKPVVVPRVASDTGNGSVAPGQSILVQLPVSWEVTIDEVAAKYTNMDERLDAMERQLLDLTRQMRTGSASLTGGITSISQGGASGVGATSNLLSNVTREASEGERTGSQSFVKVEDGVHHSGSSSRGVSSSGGVIHSKTSTQVMEEGKAAANAARAAAAHAEEPSSPLQQAVSVAKGVFGIKAPAQEALDAVPATAARQRTTPTDHVKGATVDVAVEMTEQEQQAHLDQERAKQAAVEQAKARLIQRAAEASRKGGGSPGAADAEAGTAPKGGDDSPLLARDSLYGFNRLQSAITELANSGYIESVKQLRETLLIQEWDMTNRHLAKRRGVAMFERYVAERDLVHEIGGFVVLTALYEDPDALEDLLPNDRMRMLARGMIEESLNERRMALYQSCTQTAKEMASLTSSGISSRMFIPLRQGVFGALLRVASSLKAFFFPWTRFLPF